jgi:RNA-directed DNA polymerase
VKATHGAAGVDAQSIAACAKRVKDNLYTIWNRLSSGSDFPPPVRTGKRPQANGGERTLGRPTVADRIAQMVVQSRWEPVGDPLFHPDASGYRPGQSALEAGGQARQRCWKLDGVIALDIKGFFDTIDHDLLLRAVKKHAKDKWVVLASERWLQAPAHDEAGHVTERGKGTPQGGVISPLRAHLCLHSAFDRWMQRTSPHLPCERDADEAIVHGRTEAEAQEVRAAIAARLPACELELHPEQTQIVSGKADDRRGTSRHAQCDVLG